MNAAANEILATLRAQEVELARRDAGLRNVLLGNGYIVRCAGLFMAFDVDPKTLRASNPRPIGSSLGAQRFTQRDAEMLAAATKNGAGDQAEAVHVADAVRQELDGVRKLIARIEAVAA